jgi:hypothetical protein
MIRIDRAARGVQGERIGVSQSEFEQLAALVQGLVNFLQTGVSV